MPTTFPIPSAADEKWLYPPYTGISFTYATIDPATRKAMLVEETMIEESVSKRFPVKLFPITFGAELVYAEPQHIRFIVKSWLSVLVAQAEYIENKRRGGNQLPPQRGVTPNI